MLKAGAFDIGGRCAVSASGGLISMGHPIGPTGVGQIGEKIRDVAHMIRNQRRIVRLVLEGIADAAVGLT